MMEWKQRLSLLVLVASVAGVTLLMRVGNDDASHVSAIEATVLPGSDVRVPSDRVTTYATLDEPAEVYPAPGIPAIAVSRAAKTGEAAISEADVRAYLAQHPFPHVEASQALAAEIAAIEFVSAAEASTRIGGALIVPKTTLVCLVTLTGDFRVETGEDEPFVGTTAFWVFDAGTGNLINQSVIP